MRHYWRYRKAARGAGVVLAVLSTAALAILVSVGSSVQFAYRAFAGEPETEVTVDVEICYRLRGRRVCVATKMRPSDLPRPVEVREHPVAAEPVIITLAVDGGVPAPATRNIEHFRAYLQAEEALVEEAEEADEAQAEQRMRRPRGKPR